MFDRRVVRKFWRWVSMGTFRFAGSSYFTMAFHISIK